jgi:hypothetical protein
MTGLGLHTWFNERRGRSREDTFPTLYRANTAKRLRSLGASSGLRAEQVLLIEGRPEYLRWSALSYLGGWVYERIVNSHDAFARFRVVIIGIFRKDPGGEDSP